MIKPLIIYGPTATGKTDLAIRLAGKFQGELISADSRQVYKGFDIGTGKVSFGSKIEKHKGYWVVDGVKIHGFDLINPGQQFTVADFLKFAKTTIIRIIEANKKPIVVGGTGFYIKALTDGIGSIGIPANQKLRRDLENLSPTNIHQKLLEIDLHRAQSMNQSDRANPRRLIRAIEIAQSLLTPKVGQYFTPGVSQPTTYDLLLGLTAPNDYLYKRADNWLQTRLDHGLIEEVRSLLKQEIDPQWLENLGLEYRWITRYLEGEITYDEAIERLKGDIHSFIRRQKTWFRQFKDIVIYDISTGKWRNELEKTVKSWYIS